MANPEKMNIETQLENRFKVKILLEANLESDFLVLVQDDLTSFLTSNTVFKNHQKCLNSIFSSLTLLRIFGAKIQMIVI